ncbi:uncharacterized protein PFLUO_LOCUS4425 [Penicillium psychrofluorescens]|uniref:uncharacterized protein n=1 Tax=Penicillium psychrofluorescens TaxID=3158075 RepID=UPI003CCD7DE9
MAGFNIQRPPTASLEARPRKDVELAKNAWKYVNQKIENRRQNGASKAEANTKSIDTDSESMISKADTLVVDGDKSAAKKGKE